MHNAQCTMHNAQNTMHKTKCTKQKAQFKKHNAQCTIQKAQNTMHNSTSWNWLDHRIYFFEWISMKVIIKTTMYQWTFKSEKKKKIPQSENGLSLFFFK